MEMIALAAQLANDLGMPLGSEVSERLAQGAEFLWRLSDDNGYMPAIGDDDEGRVIAQPDREPRYVASVIAAVVGLTRRDDLPIPARDPHLRDVIFDSPQQSSGEKSGLRVFEQCGVSVTDETLIGRRTRLVFDHGPLGLMPPHMAMPMHLRSGSQSTVSQCSSMPAPTGISLAARPDLHCAKAWLTIRW